MEGLGREKEQLLKYDSIAKIVQGQPIIGFLWYSTGMWESVSVLIIMWVPRFFYTQYHCGIEQNNNL